MIVFEEATRTVASGLRKLWLGNNRRLFKESLSGQAWAEFHGILLMEKEFVGLHPRAWEPADAPLSPIWLGQLLAAAVGWVGVCR